MNLQSSAQLCLNSRLQREQQPAVRQIVTGCYLQLFSFDRYSSRKEASPRGESIKPLTSVALAISFHSRSPNNSLTKRVRVQPTSSCSVFSGKKRRRTSDFLPRRILCDRLPTIRSVRHFVQPGIPGHRTALSTMHDANRARREARAVSIRLLFVFWGYGAHFLKGIPQQCLVPRRPARGELLARVPTVTLRLSPAGLGPSPNVYEFP